MNLGVMLKLKLSFIKDINHTYNSLCYNCCPIFLSGIFLVDHSSCKAFLGVFRTQLSQQFAVVTGHDNYNYSFVFNHNNLLSYLCN